MSEAGIAIIGAGAAGLAAAIFAAEAAPGATIVLLEGASKPGAKILVSGGGRCNVTNEAVSPDDYCGGPKPIVRSVLRAFDEHRTIEWMRAIGVELKLEPTGKYFPVTDKARTVLDALLGRVRGLGVDFRTGMRVRRIRPAPHGFDVETGDGVVAARRVIVATGGLALPKSGSDGAGLGWMRRLGHTVVPTTPSLAPLVLRESGEPAGRFAEFAGVTLDLRLTLHESSGKKFASYTGSTLFTHFGLSGPAPMNLSRHLARHRLEHPGDTPWLSIGLPQFPTIEDADRWLREQVAAHPRRLAANAIEELLPARVAEVYAHGMGRLAEMGRGERLELSRRLAQLRADVVGDRGYTFAECTAGGVDLREIDPRTMQSRVVPGLYLCGEILDVDGRIGGFNFQWAWSSGYLAGRGAAGSLLM